MKFLKRILSFLHLLFNPRNTPTDQNVKPSTPVAVQEANFKAENNKKISFSHPYSTPQSYPVILKSLNSLSGEIKTDVARIDKGALENYFFDFSPPEFSEKFKNTYQINLGNFIIIPDFSYVDTDKNIFLTIEIDEPYTIDTNGNFIPIHTKGYDDERNRALLHHGWSIIRFAEEQIAKYPVECMNIIHDFINAQSEIAIPIIKCWTSEECNMMIVSKYRNTYLPAGFTTAKNSNSAYSYRSFVIISISCFNSKKDEQFTVVNLGSISSVTQTSITFNQRGSCWIPEKEFAEKINASEFGKILKRIDMDYSYLYKFSIGGIDKDERIKFEGLGCHQRYGTYFNLLSSDNFNLIYPGKYLQDFQKRYETNKDFYIRQFRKKNRILGKQPDGSWLNY